MATGFSLEVLFDIADALNIAPEELLKVSLFPDTVFHKER